MANAINFAFSDLIAGYITKVEFPDLFDCQAIVGLRTSDKREFDIKVTKACYAELVRNLGEPFQVAPSLQNILAEGRFIHAYGLFYPESSGIKFEAKHIVLFGRTADHLRFEEQDWWITQIKQLLNFYLEAQFNLDEGETIDFRNFRTDLSAEGKKLNGQQNLDTISRLVYGFASAYMLTGDERALEAAVKGTEYMQRHFRFRNSTEGICYWYSQINLQSNGTIRKFIGSQAGGDEGGNAMPCYEQIYALAGPTQTFRLTGNREILRDIEDTISFLNRYFKDHSPQGGYYSHVDPVTFSPHAPSLGINQARKNWNSVGDHAPAYLINLWLATEKPEHADFLEYCFDLICKYFPDYDYSPFMNEKFHDDWSRDLSWGIHQARCVVGHNLKVAWNLTRMQSLRTKDTYRDFAHKIANIIPLAGCDNQRGGWYDMMERTLKDGEELYRLVWHDRKAWWQQEQGILAYYIMAGVYDDKPEYLRYAREGSAFYNGWFLDYDAGGIYFNVLANGQPYALGTERDKGSHSMAGYHSFELCFLAAVYTNLLINKQPMDFFFSPEPGAWLDNLLRVAPDILPKGSIRLAEVWLNGQPYYDFDQEALTVTLPTDVSEMKVRCRVVPTGTDFDIDLISFKNGVATLALNGNLVLSQLKHLQTALERLSGLAALVLDLTHLKSIDDSVLNYLVFSKQSYPETYTISLQGLPDHLKTILEESELLEEFVLV
ncbi:AGE family epimerase/isomerase [Cylindrospermopsis raciborskii]|uniref:N-acyl-D-glucosamine 2-epimerase n=1 Tax=Cylindrospermopsis raciborskii CS-505 TaxID=533240 RepID=A0A853M9A6_9CYAN|nr:AGE family epimerase/isomerase [Cylindrospermopsis raciborskii]EFA70981.1 Six-hairpin glycosidase domain protein containing protein [Cylindrospermopsis raciborskii CS-505]OBU75142.1 N-acyl-D-glucosamine 2-epimerase [Cylindrospermopsis raciborskii CS-505]PNK18605.1 N-acyl-D-glucosamine 2-epimerase [Cylindrospermopsis raciborskii S01]